MREFENIFEKIAKDITEIQDNAKAMEFTKSIGTMLRENGVVPFMAEYNASVGNGNSLEMAYGYALERLDFTEHDKVFNDEIKQLKDGINKMSVSKSEWIDKATEWQKKCEKLEKRIEELENQEKSEELVEIDTSTPIACAESLIQHMTHFKAYMVLPDRYENTFTVDELREIAEYLMVYCRHHKERDE